MQFRYLNETIIDAPYTFINLKKLLETVCDKENKYSHFEFAKWCDNLTMIFEEEDLNENDLRCFTIARDIECQWDLYLLDPHSKKILQSLDINQVSLPQEWFLEWLNQLNN
jgi:hypothetical protein